MSRSTVTTWFEIAGLLLLAAAASLWLFWPRAALAVGISGAVLIVESAVMALTGPKPTPPGVDAA